ncbi:hypothetical protein CO154_01380 [Candidatus Pacearchaeota archaeon CG_4_9_14_3_um_filter_31_7]|nr:MAG: hypothetical protein AUJ10_03110 [Candidatus Pacearchaeota archaeon CG1_02_31_27]PIN92396.1 MAG: hypothetical protein COU55_01155 [Candidatus Pacearchaeota archaeon CG10_big_fil_rev_8_21_14_0_10_31_59]PIZ80589.1 MAG: hypothetical protein COX99_02155 [Candidatus Pacearchaeota archaeon CG_4_10_14_0_2_um_filter_31_10]PJA70708.1 MAG: hypothetical protein CO154_01380 [Candidatus Pacearchaeota archaeon CG_4_9_14_3_um_filter_31_7]
MENKKKKYVKICPKCNSLDVKIDMQGALVAFGLPAIYICNDCGFKSYIFPEIDLNEVEK